MGREKKQRIAVTADGSKYLIQRIDFAARTVHCWGEVTSYRNRATKHAKSKIFAKADVEVIEEAKTADLIAELFEQTKQRLRDNDGMEREDWLRADRALKNPFAKPGAFEDL